MADAPPPSNPSDPHAEGRPPVPDLVVPGAVQPFHLAGKPVRGRLVRLGALADALLTRHDHPAAVTRLVGQALALTAALAGALKFSGSFSLQARGDGPVPMLLADCTDRGALRGYARAEPEAATAPPLAEASALLGAGSFAFTCDQGPDMERYQGIVAIEGDTLTEMTGHYFRTSEQLRTHLHLACATTPSGWRASAFILERIAGAGGIAADLDEAEQDEAWRTALALAGTLTEAELLDDALTSAELLHRLFHAEGLALDQPRSLEYGCRCVRARLADVLAGFPDDDLDHMADDGTITMNCEFCNLAFHFDRASVRGGRA